MTKSTITREQLLEIIETDHVQCGEASYLARMALAAMDSEPVAEVLSNRLGNDTSTIDRALPVGTKLYRHAQQPVVPDELNTRTANDVMNEHLSWKDYGDAEVFCIAWNACRAAMLAASPQSPGSYPATVPGKWIPVSERMPDENAEQQVLACFKGGDISTLYYFDGRWDDAYGIVPIRQDVTHWMPLPAAPQEAINVLIPLVSRNEREVK
ncbi:TPA: DUF551 domain-containing protein [Klebsiella pneumoniae]|nr:DUF551 domain-containing protein [Klebsiella pneumoniae]